MKVLFCCLLTIFATSQVVDGLKVLGVLPFISKSHFALGHGIVTSLHDVGHQVTIISPFPSKKPIANYTDYDTTDIRIELNKGDID